MVSESSSAIGLCLQYTHERGLLPCQIGSLIMPLPALLANLDIKVPEHPSQDHTHLTVCQVSSKAASWAD